MITEPFVCNAVLLVAPSVVCAFALEAVVGVDVVGLVAPARLVTYRSSCAGGSGGGGDGGGSGGQRKRSSTLEIASKPSPDAKPKAYASLHGDSTTYV